MLYIYIYPMFVFDSFWGILTTMCVQSQWIENYANLIRMLLHHTNIFGNGTSHLPKQDINSISGRDQVFVFFSFFGHLEICCSTYPEPFLSIFRFHRFKNAANIIFILTIYIYIKITKVSHRNFHPIRYMDRDSRDKTLHFLFNWNINRSS